MASGGGPSRGRPPTMTRPTVHAGPGAPPFGMRPVPGAMPRPGGGQAFPTPGAGRGVPPMNRPPVVPGFQGAPPGPGRAPPAGLRPVNVHTAH